MKKQFFQMDFKSIEVKKDGKSIFIEGYASTPDLDSYDDIVKPEAFEKTMSDYMRKPLVLLQHNQDKIIGAVREYKIEPNGLFIKAEIFNNTDGVFKSIQEGLIGQFSIGFQTLKWNIFEKEGRYIREITELELYEISAVVFPANKSATFTMKQSLKEFFEGIEQKEAGSYEVKGEEIEFIKLETKEDIIEPEVIEPEVIIETPPVITEGEVGKIPEEIQTDVVETVGEIPNTDDTDEKSEELKALKEEIELLKKDNETLKVTIEAKDLEIENITKSKVEIEKKLEEKEIEIKEYLGAGNIETKETKKLFITRTWSYFDN